MRQTLACSLHEIASIIGPELTQQDLIHPFNSFIDDIDKVKIGLLKNLAKFLKVGAGINDILWHVKLNVCLPY